MEEEVAKNKRHWKDSYKLMENYSPKEKRDKFGNSKNRIRGEKIETDKHQNLTPDDLQVHVKVFHEGLLDVIDTAAEAGFYPLVLNAASENHPLDPLKRGASGTEFELCRRSNYYNTISEEMFPLGRDNAIYCPKVTMFKSHDHRTYTRPRKFAVLTMAPLRGARLISERIDGKNQEKYEKDQDKDAVKKKIRAIFCLAVAKGHKCIVTTDFCCQRDNNPITQIIKLFNHNIRKGVVPYVFFAIKNAPTNKRDDNFLSFHKNIVRTTKLRKMVMETKKKMKKMSEDKEDEDGENGENGEEKDGENGENGEEKDEENEEEKDGENEENEDGEENEEENENEEDKKTAKEIRNETKKKPKKEKDDEKSEPEKSEPEKSEPEEDPDGELDIETEQENSLLEQLQAGIDDELEEELRLGEEKDPERDQDDDLEDDLLDD